MLALVVGTCSFSAGPAMANVAQRAAVNMQMAPAIGETVRGGVVPTRPVATDSASTRTHTFRPPTPFSFVYRVPALQDISTPSTSD